VLGAFSATAGLLAAIALLLAMSGTYAVIAYIVIQRTREFGIRIALGATAGGIVRSVVVQAARLGACGVAIGAVLALGLSQIFASVIVILPTFGAGPYALATAVILTATLGAVVMPSLRASRVNPSDALRSD
jgi:ABC-type antimicrobial peptide transport system permease subunit